MEKPEILTHETASDMTELSIVIHENNKKKGFWPEEGRNMGEVICLIHSECSELLEAERKGKGDEPCDKPILMTGLDGFERPMTNREEEIADIIIRSLDLCGHHRIDIGQAIDKKLEYNATRAHKHGKKF